MKQICTPKRMAIILAFLQKRMKNFLFFLIFSLPFFVSAQPPGNGNGNGNQPQVIPELIFQNPVLVSGTDKKERAVYRFSNVANGIDALLEIKKISDTTSVLNNLDVTSFGWNKAFQPELGRRGNVAANQNWWVRFNLKFVEAGENKKVKLSKFYVTALDVDGDNLSIQEYVQMQNADSIKLSTVSYLALAPPINTGLSNAASDRLTQGPVLNFTNIDTASTGAMATYTYINTSEIDFTLGGKSGQYVSNAGLRLNSLWFKSFNLAPPSILPLQLISFQGNVNNNKVNLQWAVADNETGRSFELEKSFDGVDFSTTALIFTTPKPGTENYAYRESIERTSFYRLKMINNDNSFSYSKVIRLSAEENATVNQTRLLQNPVGASLQFNYSTLLNENATVTVYTANGVKMFSTQIKLQKGITTYSLSLDSKMNKGIYLFEIAGSSERSVTKFIKQ